MTDRFAVYSSAPVKTIWCICCAVLDQLERRIIYLNKYISHLLTLQITKKLQHMSLLNRHSHSTGLCGIIRTDHIKCFRPLVLIIKWLSQFQSFAGKQQQKGHREQGTELISND